MVQFNVGVQRAHMDYRLLRASVLKIQKNFKGWIVRSLIIWNKIKTLYADSFPAETSEGIPRVQRVMARVGRYKAEQATMSRITREQRCKMSAGFSRDTSLVLGTRSTDCQCEMNTGRSPLWCASQSERSRAPYTV